MSTDKRIENYLAAATAGLRGDRELELDVQAELRSHLEERLADAAAAAGAGTGAADPVADALAGMGSATTVAAELAAANQARMRWRARLLRLGRWLLVPAAVIAALSSIDLAIFNMAATLDKLGSSEPSASHAARFLVRLSQAPWFPANWFRIVPRLTPDQVLIVKGDIQRPTPIQQQRAIWEAHPENKIYYHNYLTQLLASTSSATSDDAQLAAAVAEGRKLDPANARFDYAIAGRLLEQAATIDAKETGKDTKGRRQYALSWTIRDRAKLDQAMALLRAGLAKPEYRRYSREMQAERLHLLGQPRNLPELISQIALASGTLLPDLSNFRALARGSMLYADLLVREGHPAEAESFLDAWKTLAVQLNSDSFTLIDVLVTGAISDGARQYAPSVWLKAGQPARAEQARNEGERLGQPVSEWRQRVTDASRKAESAQTIKTSGSILAGLLLHALGETPTPAQLTPGRLLDYVLVERLALALAAGALLLGLAGCGLVYGRWRLAATGGAIPLLLLPNWRETLRILAYGILLPVLAYYLYSRWLPWNGREYGLGVGGPLLLAEITLLLLLMLGLTPRLAVQVVRRRCRELGIPVPPPRGGNRRWWTLVGLAVLLAVGLAVFTCIKANRTWELVLPLLCLLAIVILAGFALWALLTGLLGRRAIGLYYGSVARTLVLFLAAGTIALSLLGKTYLAVTERQLVQEDPLVHIDPDQAGITSIETRVTQRLINEIRQAAETPPPSPRTETQK